MKIYVKETPIGKSVYILKSYRCNGKSTSEVVEKLGKYEDLQKQYGDADAFIKKRKEELEKIDKENTKRGKIKFTVNSNKFLTDENNLKFAGYLPFRRLFRKLGLHELCKKNSG